MKTIEYRSIDKSTWADGPWHHEPDKRQWQDPATGLFCVIVRSPLGGNLCGYVGLPPDHPAYGLHYDGVTDAEAKANQENYRDDVRRWAQAGYPPLEKWWAQNKDRTPRIDEPIPGIGEALLNVSVHGGLTYASENGPPDREEWEAMKTNVESAWRNAIYYPRGDAARYVRTWKKTDGNYDLFVRQVFETTICCEVGADEPATLWFFGFDCAHAWDMTPAMDALNEELGIRLSRLDDQVYRDIAYVEAQVTELAKQLAALRAPMQIVSAREEQ